METLKAGWNDIVRSFARGDPAWRAYSPRKRRLALFLALAIGPGALIYILGIVLGPYDLTDEYQERLWTSISAAMMGSLVFGFAVLFIGAVLHRIGIERRFMSEYGCWHCGSGPKDPNQVVIFGGVPPEIATTIEAEMCAAFSRGDALVTSKAIAALIDALHPAHGVNVYLAGGMLRRLGYEPVRHHIFRRAWRPTARIPRRPDLHREGAA